jgi:hypothetical protein
MPDELDGAARDFARYCLNQPEPHLSDGWPSTAPKSGDHNTISQVNADSNHQRFDDVREVLSIVTDWCRLNTITLEIHYFDGVYLCRFTDSCSLGRTVETTGSADLCHELLVGASNLAKGLGGNHPHRSLRLSGLAETQKAGS